MAEKVAFTLDYRENGKIISVPLTIDFISHKCLEMYSEIVSGASRVKAEWDLISDYQTELSALRVTRQEGYKTRTEELAQLIKEATARIVELGDKKYFQKRFELARQILIDNNCPDENLLKFETWNEKIDVETILLFLESVIYKDIDKKKR